MPTEPPHHGRPVLTGAELAERDCPLPPEPPAPDAAAENTRLAARVAELEEGLGKLEWCFIAPTADGQDIGNYCPCCRNRKPFHSSRCLLGNLLEGTPDAD